MSKHGSACDDWPGLRGTDGLQQRRGKYGLAICSWRELGDVFDAIGQRTFRFGDKSTNANLVKLSGNFLIMSVIESLSEAFALIGKGGIDTREYFEFLTTTLFNAPVYKTYGNLLIEKRFHPAGFAMRSVSVISRGRKATVVLR